MLVYIFDRNEMKLFNNMLPLLFKNIVNNNNSELISINVSALTELVENRADYFQLNIIQCIGCSYKIRDES